MHVRKNTFPNTKRCFSRFTTAINKRLVSEAQMQSSILDIESTMKSLQDHLVRF